MPLVAVRRFSVLIVLVRTICALEVAPLVGESFVVSEDGHTSRAWLCELCCEEGVSDPLW
jgi:hypothetical protein